MGNRKEVMNMKMRPIEKHDWDAFAGADGWPNAAPLFGEGRFEDGTDYVLVLDKNGGCLVADDEQAQFGGYTLVREFATSAEAHAFAERLGEPKSKDEFFLAGFQEI
jgi:hypothetical protein